ncbi:MAG TPA: NAD(P)/FAD-dependent oxidoreductase [Steroidobacteraceae bacterium]|nr:NAD(P)/FAD-dependent oxidoreductase [Steroidobacteraceae bacterium]
MDTKVWDVIVVGGGPAGLSAALVLGRCRRSVLVCDAGEYRNRHARAMHGFLSRDGTAPGEFLRRARKDLEPYASVELRSCTVMRVEPVERRFRVTLADASGALSCRKLLLATGVVDELPKVARIDEFYGHTVHHCPYCDGWEARNQPIAVYGRRNRAFEMSRAMTAWSDDIVLCSDGASGLQAEQKRQLARNGVRLIEDRIDHLAGHDGQLEAIVFANGRRLPRRRLFFDLPSHAQASLPRQLGCRLRRDGSVHCASYEATDVPGVFVAGNVAGDVQLVIFAAAEGAKAAFGINRSLTREDFELNATGRRVVEHPAPVADD